jgi:hypothetical protein
MSESIASNCRNADQRLRINDKDVAAIGRRARAALTDTGLNLASWASITAFHPRRAISRRSRAAFTTTLMRPSSKMRGPGGGFE